MIIDAFPFFNELDVLELRLNTLDSVVDKFVLVESELTQSLNAKPLYFEENKERFAKFLPKIEHVIVRSGECPDNQRDLWQMEHFQRNQIMIGVNKIAANPNDILIVSDVDEIPNPEAVQTIAPRLQPNQLLGFEMAFFVYFMNLKASQRNWAGSVIGTVEAARARSPQGFRDVKDRVPFLRNSGWHFSWLGGVDRIHEKALSCIEPYDKSLVASKSEILKKFQQGLSVGRMSFIHPENLNQRGMPLEFLTSLDILPLYLQNNKKKFKHHFFEQ